MAAASGITDGRPMSRAQITALAESIEALLEEPLTDLTHEARLRWEGAFVALRVVLGAPVA